MHMRLTARSRMPAYNRHRGDCCSWAAVGFTTRLPLVLSMPIFTDAVGPLNGMSDAHRAAEAATMLNCHGQRGGGRGTSSQSAGRPMPRAVGTLEWEAGCAMCVRVCVWGGSIIPRTASGSQSGS